MMEVPMALFCGEKAKISDFPTPSTIGVSVDDEVSLESSGFLLMTE